MKKKNIPTQDIDFTDAFFKEVSEDVQNDNLKAFWKKYGIHIVAFVVVCLTVAVSFETIKHWRDKMNQRWSNDFAYAMLLQNQDKYDESIKAFEKIVKDGNDIYADEANIKIINILLEQNKLDEAFAKLEEFVKSANNDKLKNIAIMKLATYKADSASVEEMSKLLEPIIDAKNSVWRLEAKELIALTYLRENNKEKALEIYETIAKANDINDILRARAQNMISVLTSAGDRK